MISYAEQLRQVRDSLTEENWSKMSWVNNKSGNLCMCVHAAAQRIANPKIRELFNDSLEPNWAQISQHILRDRIINSAGDGANNIGDLRRAWLNRQSYTKINKRGVVDYGNANLHYLMGMFGITILFNDHPDTTLDMIKDKLSEAAKWAEENEGFLNNN